MANKVLPVSPAVLAYLEAENGCLYSVDPGYEQDNFQIHIWPILSMELVDERLELHGATYRIRYYILRCQCDTLWLQAHRDNSEGKFKIFYQSDLDNKYVHRTMMGAEQEVKRLKCGCA